MAREKGRSLIAQNRRARHDYQIEDTFEAGLVLVGTEVKSLRAGRATLTDGFAEISDGEAWVRGIHIPEYEKGSWTNHEPRRKRKLLLKRSEIAKLEIKTKQGGYTLVPLSIYFKDGYAKVEIAVAKGRKTHDKRHAIAAKESKREAERAMGRHAKGMSD